MKAFTETHREREREGGGGERERETEGGGDKINSLFPRVIEKQWHAFFFTSSLRSLEGLR